MADINGSIISDSINNAAEGITSKLTDAATTNNVGLNKLRDGLTAIKESTLKTEVTNLPKEFAQVYQLLSISVPHITTIKNILQGDQKSADDKEQQEMEWNKTGQKDWTDSDLSKLPAWASAGSLYIVSELKKIFQPTTKTKAADSDSKGAKGPSLDFSDKGWQELAATLIAYATAAKALNVVTIKMGIIGLRSLAVFIDKTVELIDDQSPNSVLAKHNTTWGALKNRAKFFGQFASQIKVGFEDLADAAISASLLAMFGLMGTMGVLVSILFIAATSKLIEIAADKFDLKKLKKGTEVFDYLKRVFTSIVAALVMASLVLILVVPALLGLVGVIVFLLALAVVGLIAGLLKMPLALLSSTIITIAVTMLLLAITLWVISNTLTDGLLEKTLAIVISVGVLLLVFALLGFLAGLVAVAVTGLLVATVMILLSVLALWLVFIILDKLPDPATMLDKVSGIGEFFMILVMFIPTFIYGLIASALLAVASLLLMLGLIFLYVAVIFLGLVADAIAALLEKEIKGAPKGIAGALGLIAVFYLSIAVMFFVFILALPAIIVLTITSILLFVSFLFLMLTIGLATLITSMITPQLLLLPLALTAFFMGLVPLGLVSLLVIVVAIPLLIASVLLLAIFIALTVTIALALAIQAMSESMDAGKIRQKIYDLFGVVMNPGLIFKCIAILFVAAPVLAASLMMLAIFASIAGAYLAIQKLNEIQESTPDPSGVFKAVEQLAEIVGVASEKTEDTSIWALAKFKIGIGAITEAIALIVDTIIKIADRFGGEKGDALLAKSIAGLKKITTEFFGMDENGQIIDGKFTILTIINNLSGISKSQLRAAEALKPLTEALDNITETILKVNGIDNIDQGIENLKLITQFIAGLNNFVKQFSGGGLFGIGSSVGKIETATECIQAMGPLIEEMEILGKKVVGFSEVDKGTENVIALSKFIAELQLFTEGFTGGFFGIGGSISKVKTAEDTIKAMNPLIDQMTILGNKVVAIQAIQTGTRNVIQLTEFIMKLQEFTEGFSNGFLGIGSSKDSVKTATDTVASMIPLVNHLATIAQKSSEFQQIKLNIDQNIVAPLLNLDQPLNRLRQVKDEIIRLNSELTKLSKDNKDTLTSLGQIGNGTPSSIGSVIGKIRGFFDGGSNTQSGSFGEKADPLVGIAKDVKGIAEFLIKPPTSWASSETV